MYTREYLKHTRAQSITRSLGLNIFLKLLKPYLCRGPGTEFRTAINRYRFMHILIHLKCSHKKKECVRTLRILILSLQIEWQIFIKTQKFSITIWIRSESIIQMIWVKNLSYFGGSGRADKEITFIQKFLIWLFLFIKYKNSHIYFFYFIFYKKYFVGKSFYHYI